MSWGNAGLLIQNSCQQTRMETRMLLSSSYGDGTFHRRSYDLLQGKGRTSFPCLPFLKFLQLEIFMMASCHILGAHILILVSSE